MRSLYQSIEKNLVNVKTTVYGLPATVFVFDMLLPVAG